MGRYHFPRWNGPGLSLSRPDVILRNIGVAYEVYNPMTEALPETQQSVYTRLIYLLTLQVMRKPPQKTQVTRAHQTLP